MFMKKHSLTAFVLSLVTLLTCLPTYAASGGASSGGSTGGIGSGTVVSPSYSVSVPMRELRVSGTIQLPEGFTAPPEGLSVYGAFGGASLNTLSLSEFTETETTAYEAFDVLLTIPAGQSRATFETKIQISSASDAFYGAFWVYDTNIQSNRGTQYLSNQIATSSIIKLKANTTTYSNLDVTLAAADSALSCSIIFDRALSNETPNQSIYIIADDGYDSYITRQKITGCAAEVNTVLRVPNGDYTLSYYIPSSTDMINQRIPSGTHTVGAADLSADNTILIDAQTCVTGRISRPDSKTSETLQLSLSTSAATVHLTLAAGASAVNYVIAAQDAAREYLLLDILNSDFYTSGYWDGTEFCDNRSYYDYVTEMVATPIQISLQRQCLITGSITLPQGVTMDENTYFNLYVVAESESGAYKDSVRVKQYSDSEAVYAIAIPYAYRDESLILAYHYGSYDAEVTFPQTATNPLTYYKRNSSGGSASGGGGGSSGGSSGGSLSYSPVQPEGLLYNRLIYINNAKGGFNKAQAQRFSFSDDLIQADIKLAAEGDVTETTAIGGYFKDVLSHHRGDVVIQLIKADDGSVCYRQTPNGATGAYCFNNITDGRYNIAAVYEGTTYYYTGKRLSTNKADAKVINTTVTAISYQNDFYYDNIFPVNIACKTVECLINEQDVTAQIGIYDIYGQCHATYDSDEMFPIPFSPFVMSVNGSFVSSYTLLDRCEVTQVTPNFEQAAVIEAAYRDTLSARMGELSARYDTFRFNLTVAGVDSLSNWLDEGCYSEPVLSNNTFYITKPEELAWVAYKVKNGSLFVNKTVRLMCDIDLSARQWTPIGGLDADGNATEASAFRGVFDGGGYTISGLQIGTALSHANYSYSGLFGYVMNATLQNVSLTDVSIYNSGKFTAALSGYSDEQTVNHVTVSGSVSVIGGIYAGAITAYGSGSIMNSSSTATVSGHSTYSGQLVGGLSGSLENSAAPAVSKNGLSIAHSARTIRNCYEFTGENSLLFYDKNCENETLTLKKEDEALLKRLNSNSNSNWSDWAFNSSGYPTPTRQVSRFWQADTKPLKETNGVYLIQTAEELARLAAEVSSGNSFIDKTVALTANLDLSSKYWLPIGNVDYPFSGSFDGRNHTISGLRFDSSEPYVGLFGTAEDATIKNMTLNGVQISAGNNVAALCGLAYNTTIDNVSISGTVSGATNVGGLVGYLHKRAGGITQSRVNATVSGTTNVGGLVGYSYHLKPCATSCFNGRVSGSDSVGGLIGYCSYSDAEIDNCYAVGHIEGQTYMGGLIGRGVAASLSNCYASAEVYGGLYVGAIVGYEERQGVMRSVYWNLSKEQNEDGFTLPIDSKKAVGSGTESATPLTEEEFSQTALFTGWDFDSLWGIENDFPTFRRYWRRYDYTIQNASIIGGYAVANVQKDTEATDNVAVYYAVYQNDKLIDVVRDELNMTTNTKLLQSSVPLSIGDIQNVVLKVFILNEACSPMAKSITATIEA